MNKLNEMQCRILEMSINCSVCTVTDIKLCLLLNILISRIFINSKTVNFKEIMQYIYKNEYKNYT